MRITIPALFLFSLLVGSCTTDFVLEAEWEDIPIVYGFLSLQDTAHYIRVEKVFLEPGGNGEDIARIADSLYYEPGQATVILEKVNTGQRYTLTRVIGEDEGYPRGEGIFATTPNVLYKIKASQVNLSGGQRVRIIVERPNEEPAVAETTVVSPLVINRPSEGGSIGFTPYLSINSMEFEAASNTRVFDVRAVVKYRESLPGSTTQFVNKTIDWELDDFIERERESSSQNFQINSVSFYLLIAGKLEPNPQVIRRMDGIDFFVTGGGSELSEFLTILNANTGITSAEQAPVYSNVTNGFGILTSRYRASALNIQLDANTRDSLRNGIYTKALNFVP